MSYIAGLLLLHLGDEYQTFVAFANLLHRRLPFTFYSFDMASVNVVFHVFMKLMASHIPKLNQVFTEMGLECSMFLFEWSVAIFSNILPLQISTKLWDKWLLEDEV